MAEGWDGCTEWAPEVDHGRAGFYNIPRIHDPRSVVKIVTHEPSVEHPPTKQSKGLLGKLAEKFTRKSKAETISPYDVTAMTKAADIQDAQRAAREALLKSNHDPYGNQIGRGGGGGSGPSTVNHIWPHGGPPSNAKPKINSNSYPPFMKPVDVDLSTPHKQSSLTGGHMSETQDISDMAEELVSVDQAIRSELLRPEACKRFVEARTISADGAHIGREGITEGEEAVLAGIGLGEGHEIVAVFRVPNPDPTEHTKFDMPILRAERAFPEAWRHIESCVRANTNWDGADVMHHQVRQRLMNKPALADIVRAQLKEGRRAFEERSHEAEEDAAGAFYAAQDDFGAF